MKTLCACLAAFAVALIFLFCPRTEGSVEYLRIHIRANSNSQEDQEVKYQVKDAVVEALIPLLCDAETFEKAKSVVEENFSLIEEVSDAVLKTNGFNYRAKAEIKTEFFPSRVYDDLVLEEGNYQALIVNLGSGEGNNWWCLVFPAFCFTKSTNSDNVEYISKIWQIIKNITGEEE